MDWIANDHVTAVVPKFPHNPLELSSSALTGIASVSTVSNAANSFVRSVAAKKLRKRSVDAAR